MARSADKVVVGYVHPVEVSAYFHESLIDLMMWDLAHDQRIVNGGGRIGRYSSANISAERNTIVRMFLEQSTAQWLWMVDADMHFAPDTLDRLLVEAHEKRAPIVGGLCFGIDDGVLFPTLYGLVDDPERGIGTVRYKDFPDNAMFQVAATGAACLLMHRSALEAIRDKGFNRTFPWFQETELNGNPCGEDFTLCLRAGQLGIPVYVNTGVEIGHHKSMVLTRQMFDEQRRADG